MGALLRWLRYHRSLGIHHVFVHVEDTPDLLGLLASEEFADFVTVTSGMDNSLDAYNPLSIDNYYTQVEWIRTCRRAMFTHVYTAAGRLIAQHLHL